MVQVGKSTFIQDIYTKHVKAVWVHILLIYLVVFVLGALLLFPVAKQNVVRLTHEAMVKLESTFTQLQSDLNFLTEQETTNKECNSITTILRSEVFQSDIAKEIGIFKPSGEIYCTSNDAKTSFFLYQTIMDRLKNNQVTLSYTKSKLSKERTVFLLFTGHSGYGVSVVIPPRYITRLMDFISEPGITFSIEVISRNLIDVEQNDNLFESTQEKSEHYPLKIKLQSSYSYYFHYILSQAWLGVLLASSLSIYFVLSQQKKLNRGSLETALKGALSDQLLDVYYQPIVDSRTKEIVGCESLVRWKDPIQGYISPAIFIPLAEKLELIDEVTEQVMTKVVRLLSDKGDCFEGRYVSVNISRSLILQDDFIQRMVSYFQQNPKIANKLVFEITEEINFLAGELEVLQANLKKVTDVGIRIAIDDFGTGYSGLNFIRQYPFDIFKIDRVFVTNLSNDSTIIPLLKSMEMISQTLNMNVIVEGVEEAEQVTILAELGFHNIQGFYFYKPMPKTELLKLLT